MVLLGVVERLGCVRMQFVRSCMDPGVAGLQIVGIE